MTDDNERELERIPSGIPGLDVVLRGGFLKGGVYIIQGAPGAGKTILANQVCFRHVADDGRAVFVTLLAESHTRMLQHLRPMSFYAEGVIPDRLYYVSGFDILENDGLKGIVDLLRREIKGHQASLLVLDGFGTTEESASSPREFKKFVHEIQSHAAAAECTVLLLTNGSNRAVTPEHTMVDGLIELDDRLFDQRTERSLRVGKFRGSGFLRGRHPFRITGDGIVIFPRIEAAFALPSPPDRAREGRLSTGVRGLDAVIGGALVAATTTAVIGPSGAGKTTLGLQFLSLSSSAEPGLFFGFFESPDRLRDKAAATGIDLAGLEDRGDVEVIWQPQGEHILDELGHRVIDAARRRGVKRLFIDGLGGFIAAAVFPERISRYFSALANELRALGVTTIYTAETPDIIGSTMRMPIDGMSSIVENLIVMRYVELQAETHRLLSITKIRDSDFDASLREFKITSRGIEVGERIEGVEAILSGYGREPKAVAAEAETNRQSGKPRRER